MERLRWDKVRNNLRQYWMKKNIAFYLLSFILIIASFFMLPDLDLANAFATLGFIIGFYFMYKDFMRLKNNKDHESVMRALTVGIITALLAATLVIFLFLSIIFYDRLFLVP